MSNGTPWKWRLGFTMLWGLLGAMQAHAVDDPDSQVGLFRWSGSNHGLSQKRLLDLSESSGNNEQTPYARFDRSHALHIKMTPAPTAEQGSILLWVKPDWTTPREHSKSLLTMRWNDPHNSYLAISEGWWEPTGEHQLYFVISNQEYATCTSDTHLKRGYWSLIGVTWKAGVNGSCAIYLNGDQLIQAPIGMNGHYQSSGELIVGSDTGSTNQRDRSAEGWLAELQWFPRELNASDVMNAFERTLGGNQHALRHRWQWLTDAININSTGDVALPKNEVRALFDESSDWAQSRADTDRILSRMHAAGFNVYVPCVWHGAGTYYPTQLAHVSHDINHRDSTYNALAYLVEHAHKLDIEVHPWITVARREDNAHPEYAETGTPPGAYDVHNQAFRKFIVALTREVLERYAVDGINLDYIRSMGMCTSVSCAADYQKKTGRNLRKDLEARGHDQAAYRVLVNWQDAAVVDIVREIKKSRDRYRPAAILSIDGNVQLQDANRPLQGRDELGWLHSRLIDVVFDMDYESNLDIERLDQIFANTEPGRVIPLLSNFDVHAGVAAPRPDWVVADLVTLARQRWPNSGTAFYMSARMDDAQQNLLSHSVFKTSVTTPWHAQSSHNNGLHCAGEASCVGPVQ